MIIQAAVAQNEFQKKDDLQCLTNLPAKPMKLWL